MKEEKVSKMCDRKNINISCKYNITQNLMQI